MKKKNGSSSPPSMDELTAHLDRGWDLLRKNDFRGAENSAQKALDLEADSPEALTLLGAIAAGEGDEEEALEQFRRAMEADPEYVSPMLYTAEILLGPDGDPDEALKLIDEALELAEDEDEYLDGLLLKAEALVALGDADDEAREALGELPEDVQFSEPVYHLRAARCYYDLGEVDEALEHYTRCLSEEPDNSDAWHGMGLVHEERGDQAAQVEAWKKVRKLDLDEEPAPWAITADEFGEIADAAVAELPARIKKLLENVPILASAYPSEEFIADGGDPRVLGFFDGLPYPEKSNAVGDNGHLDCINLYQRNIERMCRSREEVEEEVRITVLHETAHFFGMSEEDLETIGLD
jgi:predicted Zn-dependent protease with MMP-like domain/Flp pilus assembly protein TadD